MDNATHLGLDVHKETIAEAASLATSSPRPSSPGGPAVG